MVIPVAVKLCMAMPHLSSSVMYVVLALVEVVSFMLVVAVLDLSLRVAGVL